MYVTIRRYEGVDTGALTGMVRARGENEGVKGIISEIPGFLAYYLVDAGNGQLVAINVYLDWVEAQVSTSSALDWVQKNLSAVVPNPPEVIMGEVLSYKVK